MELITPGQPAKDLVFSQHAVARYRERVKPALTLGQARRELSALAATAAALSDQPPDWAWDEPDDPGLRWLLIGDAIAFPVRRRLVVTCMTRSSYAPGARLHHTRHKRQVRAAKRAASKDPGAKARRRADKQNPSRRRRQGRPDDLEGAA